MSNSILFSFPGQLSLAEQLSKQLNVEMGIVDIHKFPDGETSVRIQSDVRNKTAMIVSALNHPNEKILPLMFMAQTLKELGASKIILIAPYLPYMRQDKRFQSGEAITAVLFAKFMSTWIDGLITIDPHLHRIKHLADIYAVNPVTVLHATSAISEWIKSHVTDALLIGPDAESRQWVEDIAHRANADYIICNKIRMGDEQVNVTLPEIKNTGKTPVLVDDIISSGASMMETLRQLLSRGFKHPICIGVHALFDAEVEKKLLTMGARQIITCNTIPHHTNKIDLTDLIADSMRVSVGNLI